MPSPTQRRLKYDKKLPTSLPRTDTLVGDFRIEKNNLLQWSEDLTNAAWQKTTGGTGAVPVVTAGSSDPLGGATAFRVQFALNGGTTSTDNSTLVQAIGGIKNPHAITVGVWMKSNTVSTYLINWGDTANGLDNNFGSVSVTPSWQFYTVQGTGIANTISSVGIRLRMGSWVTSDSADILIWHPQANDTADLKPYEATTTNQLLINSMTPTSYNGCSNSQDIAGGGWARTRTRSNTNTAYGPFDDVNKTNILRYSNKFAATIWGQSAATVTANQDVYLDGLTLVDRIFDTSANNTHLLSQTATGLLPSTNHTYSVIAKAGTLNFISVGIVDGAGILRHSVFNLNTGAVGTTTSGTSSRTITSLGSGWYQCTIKITTSATFTTSPSLRIYVSATDSISAYVGTGSYVSVARAWLNLGNTDLGYQFTAGDGACTADKLHEDSTVTSTHFLSQAITLGETGLTLTSSVYAKPAERTQLYIGESTGAGGVLFTLTSTGSVGAPSGICTGGTISYDAGTGYYRCSMTLVNTATSFSIAYFLATGSSTTYSGDGLSGLYLTAFQLNQGGAANVYLRNNSLLLAWNDVQYGWGYHARLGSSFNSDTNDPSVRTGLLALDAVDDFITASEDLLDVNEWTLLVALSSGSVVNPRIGGSLYDGPLSASTQLSMYVNSSTSQLIAEVNKLDGVGVQNAAALPAGSWPTNTWGIAALTFNRLTGAVTLRSWVNSVIETVQVTVSPLFFYQPGNLRFFNSPANTASPANGGGAYAAIWQSALTDVQFVQACKYIRKIKQNAVGL